MFNSSPTFVETKTSIVKTRQIERWNHLPAISRSEEGIGLGGGGVQYIFLIGCRLSPLDGYVSVCLVLTIVVFGREFGYSFKANQIWALL